MYFYIVAWSTSPEYIEYYLKSNGQWNKSMIHAHRYDCLDWAITQVKNPSNQYVLQCYLGNTGKGKMVVVTETYYVDRVLTGMVY